MNKRAWLSAVLIVLGLLTAGYPLWLYMDSRTEQNALIKEFQEEKNKGKEDIAILGAKQSEDTLKISSIPNDLSSREENQTEVPKAWSNTVMRIPKLGIKVMVTEMEDTSVFKRDVRHSPAHYPDTAFPGEIGNVAIAGHRTGPAGYFRNLNRLVQGDQIILETLNNVYTYEVEKVFVTSKYDWEVIAPQQYAALTLTTCQAVGAVSNAKRLIVRAKLDSKGLLAQQ